jgi:hypothetical protein
MNPLVKAIDANLRILELQAENERLRAALEAVEWAIESVCPWCEQYEWVGHAKNCARQLALKPQEGAAEGKAEFRSYNRNYGDTRVCKCGHKYYRHFDTHDDMADVGCKYCDCGTFEPQQPAAVDADAEQERTIT